MNPKPPKRVPGDSTAKKMKKVQIYQKAMAGEPVGEIAKDLGMNRNSVTKILNSDEVKAKVAAGIQRIENRLPDMIDDAMDTLHAAILNKVDGSTAFNAAKTLLKNFGGLKDQVEFNHNFPARTVIQKLDGTQVILGTESDKEEES